MDGCPTVFSGFVVPGIAVFRKVVVMMVVGKNGMRKEGQPY